MQMARHHPDLVRGCEDDVGWSREAQPQRHAWSDDTPVRLVEKTVPAKAPESQAIACDGLAVPTTHQMLWRFVQGRPVNVVTGAVLAWLASSCTDHGKRVLLLIWDHASWHVSQTVQQWLTAHNRHAKHAGSCRMMVCRLPSKRPWLNPLEPKWVHGKRAVVEPARVLSMTALMPRVCAYYQCEPTDPMAQPDC
jgi:hypothetical protein